MAIISEMRSGKTFRFQFGLATEPDSFKRSFESAGMELSATKRKIIEAAEVEFAKQGYAGASIRSITKTAGVNLAAVNYHFGSKEDLFKHMARYRFEPINELRFRLLDDLEVKHAPEAPPAENVIEIIIRPLVTNFMAKGASGGSFMRAMGKALSEERPFMQKLQRDLLKDIVARVASLLHRTANEASQEQISYCMHFISCSIVGAMIQHSRLETLFGEGIDAQDAEKLSNRLTQFVSGGVQSILATPE